VRGDTCIGPFAANIQNDAKPRRPRLSSVRDKGELTGYLSTPGGIGCQVVLQEQVGS
jgi:hypothetical protein